MSSKRSPGHPAEHLQAQLPRLVEVLKEGEDRPHPATPLLAVGAASGAGSLPVLKDVINEADVSQSTRASQVLSEAQIDALTASLEATLAPAIEALARQLARQRAERLTRAMVHSWLQEAQTQWQRTVGEFAWKTAQATYPEHDVPAEQGAGPAVDPRVTEAEFAEWRLALKTSIAHALSLKDGPTNAPRADPEID